MARADSTVRVNIIGDAKSLKGATKDAEKAVGGMSSSIKRQASIAGGAIAGAFAVDAVLDFSQTALAEADRIGDATTRLKTQLGDLSGPLIAAAGDMEKLGQSRQDVLELEARFTDLTTAAHLSAAEIAANAKPATEAAAALALLGVGGGDAATVLDLIGKAAGGGSKPLKELGIDLSDTEVEARAMATTGKDNAKALTESELAAARLSLILEKLQPRISAVTDGTADLEMKQSELQARFETLTGKIGEATEGPLTDFLTWVLNGIDGIETLADAVKHADQMLRAATRGALGFLDVIKNILARSGPLASVFGLVIPSTPRTGPISGQQGAPHPGITVNVQGGSPEVIERAVIDAVNHARSTGRIP